MNSTLCDEIMFHEALQGVACCDRSARCEAIVFESDVMTFEESDALEASANEVLADVYAAWNQAIFEDVKRDLASELHGKGFDRKAGIVM